MLENLIVKNIALIENAEINFGKGLNVLTGETGAGKSILIDSIGILLGDRTDKTLLRTGETSCKVIGTFLIEDNILPDIKLFCEENAIEFDDKIIVCRTYNASGKSDIRINGEPVTLSMLKKLCSKLVDSFGQNENQTVFDTGNHIKILDDFACTQKQDFFEQYTNLYSQLVCVDAEISSYGGSEEERARSIDILQYQVNEIETAGVSTEDYEQVESKRRILSNLGKIVSGTTVAQNELCVAIDSVSKSKNMLEQSSRYDENLQGYADRLQSVQIELDDIFESTKEYNSNIDFGEAEQQKVEERYNLYSNLMRKYGKTVEEIQENFEHMKSELEKLKSADEIVAKLQNKKVEIVKDLTACAEKITKFRVKKADELCNKIEQNLKNLNMKNARLSFQFSGTSSKFGNFDKLGADKVELLFSANLGEDLKPLCKIASGGEISRFMLALKSVVAVVDSMPTMIFDEIDTGISGATSEAVAQQMAVIAKNHQVIVVTHSQQIASMADTNFLIEKAEVDSRTTTNIKKLTAEQKVFEIARFMSGSSITNQSIKNAQQLIKEQDEYKKQLENFAK